jgi:hypothetical protein
MKKHQNFYNDHPIAEFFAKAILWFAGAYTAFIMSIVAATKFQWF